MFPTSKLSIVLLVRKGYRLLIFQYASTLPTLGVNDTDEDRIYYYQGVTVLDKEQLEIDSEFPYPCRVENLRWPNEAIADAAFGITSGTIVGQWVQQQGAFILL